METGSDIKSARNFLFRPVMLLLSIDSVPGVRGRNIILGSAGGLMTVSRIAGHDFEGLSCLLERSPSLDKVDLSRLTSLLSSSVFFATLLCMLVILALSSLHFFSTSVADFVYFFAERSKRPLDADLFSIFSSPSRLKKPPLRLGVWFTGLRAKGLLRRKFCSSRLSLVVALAGFFLAFDCRAVPGVDSSSELDVTTLHWISWCPLFDFLLGSRVEQEVVLSANGTRLEVAVARRIK